MSLYLSKLSFLPNCKTCLEIFQILVCLQNVLKTRSTNKFFYDQFPNFHEWWKTIYKNSSEANRAADPNCHLSRHCKKENSGLWWAGPDDKNWKHSDILTSSKNCWVFRSMNFNSVSSRKFLFRASWLVLISLSSFSIFSKFA